MKAATMVLAVVCTSCGQPKLDLNPHTTWLSTVKRGAMDCNVRALGTIASRTTVELKIAERDIAQLRRGQEVGILPPKVDWLHGSVTRIDSAILDGFATAAVELRHPTMVPPGMSVDASVELESLHDVVYVGRPVFADRNREMMVFQIDSERAYATRVRVRFGRSSVGEIEVLGGLQVGDVIILSDMSFYEQYDRVSLK